MKSSTNLEEEKMSRYYSTHLCWRVCLGDRRNEWPINTDRRKIENPSRIRPDGP